ncbi:MAG: MFS transporter [Candidatus Hodarchaeales archaeon]
MVIINSILGTSELPKLAQIHMRSVLSLSMIISFLMSLSSTFYILFVIDNVGFTLAAVTTSVMLITQLIFDYPSGSLGDWIGQRWILAIAFICYSLQLLLLISAQNFSDFVVISIISGFGNAQSSGAFETWIDNNYRKAVGKVDSERRVYGFVMSRVGSMNNLALGASFLIGGALATEISRSFVFSIQFGLSLIVILLILIFIRDIKTEQDEIPSNGDLSKNGYISQLTGGLKFLIRNKITFFFITGLSVYNVVWLIWGNLILFPIYYGYTGSDVEASTLRTVLFFVGIPVSFYMANVIKKIKNERLSHVIFLQILFFFPSFILLTHFVPPMNEFNPVGIIGTFLLLAILVGSLFDMSRTLAQRILLDLVPSENRNAIYSLMPSIISSIGIPILPVAGAAVESWGLPIGIAMAGFVCIIGFIMLSYSLHLKFNPKTTELKEESPIPGITQN